MGFDLRDITELLPFISDNLDKCVYIIIVSLIIGFSFGKFTSKFDSKSKKNLKAELQTLTDENKHLKERLNSTQKNSSLQTPFTPLVDFEQLINSEAATVEINALYEIKVKNARGETKSPRD